MSLPFYQLMALIMSLMFHCHKPLAYKCCVRFMNTLSLQFHLQIPLCIPYYIDSYWQPLHMICRCCVWLLNGLSLPFHCQIPLSTGIGGLLASYADMSLWPVVKVAAVRLPYTTLQWLRMILNWHVLLLTVGMSLLCATLKRHVTISPSLDMPLSTSRYCVKTCS